jgi:hypothetical protein
LRWSAGSSSALSPRTAGFGQLQRNVRGCDPQRQLYVDSRRCSNVSNAQIAVIAGRVANGSNRPFVHFKICPVKARESGLWLNGTHPFEPKRAFPFGPRTFGGGPLGSAEGTSATPAPRSLPLASLDKRHPLRGSKASSRAPATKRDRISNGVATKSATVSGRRSRACRQSRHSRRSESGATDSQIWRCTV